MALPRVDAVCIGVGWAGGILAAELTKAGMSVVGLERGGPRGPEHLRHGHDELRYQVDKELAQPPAVETWTLRHTRRERALPIRRVGAFAPASGVGGSGVTWAGQTWRFSPRDFAMRSRAEDRYGKGAVPDEMSVQDWGIGYGDLEPYYDRFERMAGIAGRAGNIGGSTQRGGNPFEGPRSRDYPVPPLKESRAGEIFRRAAGELGYSPFPGPAAALSQRYTNPDGVTRDACTYCGFTGHFGCRVGAKADPTVTVIPEALRTGRFELRTNAAAVEILHDGTEATGVRYRDAAGRLQEQPADLVLLTAYTLGNCRLLLRSGLGEPYDPDSGTGTVGKNYCYQADGAAGMAYFADEDFQPYMAGCGSTVAFDDLNGDNFDHAGLGFLGGGLVKYTLPGLPVTGMGAPPGAPLWGAQWKRAIRDFYPRTLVVGAQGESPAYRDHFLDLDPTYRDAFGDPLLRITFDWRRNEREMVRFLGGKMQELVDAMGADQAFAAGELADHFDTASYQSTHNTGGAIMGDDPCTSAVNPHLQMWDHPNVFVVGASAFPQNPGYNPTSTVCALAYRAADAIVNTYRHDPGPLA